MSSEIRGVKAETRNVLSGQDDQFLFEVYASSRREEMMFWGWSEEQRLHFLRMQFYCREQSYKMQYPNLEKKIIMSDEVKIGQIQIDRSNGEMVLVDMALLPEYRCRGIGTSLLIEIQHEALNTGRFIRLSVLNGNPALRLYQRLGFQCIGSNGIYTMMRWDAVKGESMAIKI